LNQEAYRKLVSGQKKGLGAALLRALLGILACPYSLVIHLRNLFYSKGLFKAHQANAAIISIGNITAGGTGKTPLVVWLCNEIAQNPKFDGKGYRCAILTRGYKAGQGPLLDEPAILAESCPDARVVVNPDRAAGAAEAIAFGANVMIMDDGFQHRRLARDLDIVAIDATTPFGYGRILPAGLLREPVSELKRAGAVVITRSDQATDARLKDIEQRSRDIKNDIVVARALHAPVCAIARDGNEISLEGLKERKVFAFCGIGNPNAFVRTLEGVCGNVLDARIFDDHHHYTEGCLTDIRAEAERLNADLVLTTQKDWTKVAALLTPTEGPDFGFLSIEMRFEAGEDELRGLIEEVLAGRICGK
jgi:tetraacyldisaccharide 4'-kinase